jgi:hypothetical protein
LAIAARVSPALRDSLAPHNLSVLFSTVNYPEPPPIRGRLNAAFPLPEGDVLLSFPAEMSVASAQTIASFVKLLLEQAERQAKTRESSPKDDAAN